MTVIRIEVAADDPDTWALELCHRMALRQLARTPRWRVLKRRELLAQIGTYEDKLRSIAAERDLAALDRTRRLITEGEP